jgi:hypothetical protein
MVGLMLSAACSSPPQQERQTPEAPPPAPAPSSTPTAAPGRAAICDKLVPAAAETIGVATTTSRPLDQAGLPLRCIYDPDSTKGPWFELVPGGRPESERDTMKSSGGKITDLPELGPGSFAAEWSMQNWVIGAKGDTLIKVTGAYDFPKLQAFWQKVAAEL